MRSRFRRWWPVLKLLLGLAILFAVGWRFVRDLQDPHLWERPLHPGWLLLSGLLYLAGISLSGLYWQRLLGHLGARPPLVTAMRAYFVGHLGKYLPGKAWSLLLRTTLVHSGGVRLGLATLTCFYEVLTTMAAGVLVAAVLFALLGAQTGTAFDVEDLRRLLRLEAPAGIVVGRWPAVLLSLALLAAMGLPLLPPLFNRLIHHLSLPFRERDAARLPHIRLAHFGEGLLLAGAGWLLLGASLAATLQGIVGGMGSFWDAPTLGRLAAAMGLSCVIGFVIVVAPGGLGVREFFLTLFLTPELAALPGMDPVDARGTAVLAVLVLRLVWTASELIVAGLLYRQAKVDSRQ
jgi:uncharacterized membrane protein YbhN (UPF0104 family)